MSSSGSGYEHDVFLSYAHLDDASTGWICALHDRLAKRASELLGRSVRVWRDQSARWSAWLK